MTNYSDTQYHYVVKLLLSIYLLINLRVMYGNNNVYICQSLVERLLLNLFGTFQTDLGEMNGP